jgi:hypothetical protein
MLKLFDKTFFRLAFLFLVIVFAGFLIILAIGYYDLNNKRELPQPDSNIAKTAPTTGVRTPVE